jgi:hypothetical protein
MSSSGPMVSWIMLSCDDGAPGALVCIEDFCDPDHRLHAALRATPRQGCPSYMVKILQDQTMTFRLDPTNKLSCITVYAIPLVILRQFPLPVAVPSGQSRVRRVILNMASLQERHDRRLLTRILAVHPPLRKA